jgi:hypothetical protein
VRCDPDGDEEVCRGHVTFVGPAPLGAAAVDPLLTALDVFLTGPPLESET